MTTQLLPLPSTLTVTPHSSAPTLTRTFSFPSLDNPPPRWTAHHHHNRPTLKSLNYYLVTCNRRASAAGESGRRVTWSSSASSPWELSKKRFITDRFSRCTLPTRCAMVKGLRMLHSTITSIFSSHISVAYTYTKDPSTHSSSHEQGTAESEGAAPLQAPVAANAL